MTDPPDSLGAFLSLVGIFSLYISTSAQREELIIDNDQPY